MLGDEGVIVFRAEPALGDDVFKNVAVVAGRFALSQSEDVGETEHAGHERGEERGQERFAEDDEQDKEQGDAQAEAADEPPKETAFQTPGLALGIGRGIGVGEAKLVFGGAHQREYFWYDSVLAEGHGVQTTSG